MGILKYQQWKERIISKRLAAAFEMEEPIPHLLMKGLRWLGHVAHMKLLGCPKVAVLGTRNAKTGSQDQKEMV